MLLDEIISATVNGQSFPAKGATVVSSNNDTNSINFVAGMSDPGEMIRCGYRPELRRIPGEADNVYQARILPLVMRLPKSERDVIMTAAIRRASLASKNGKINLMYFGEVPWHGLGTQISQAATAKEALEFAGLANWDLRKLQSYVDFGDKRLINPKSFGIVRGDTGIVLGSVGDRYEIMSNEECFDFMDVVIENGAHYEVAGALGNGETVWMLAKMPEVTNVVAGDEIHNFVMFGTSHDGSSAIWVYPTNVRSVCKNTYRQSFSDRKNGLSFRHTKNAKDKAEKVKEALGLVRHEQAKFAEQASFLASRQLADPQAYFDIVLDDVLDTTIAGQAVTRKSIDSGEVLNAILKLDDVAKRNTAEKQLERATKRRKELLDDILTRHDSERNNGMPGIEGTSWAGFNSMTEHADHSPLWRYRGSESDKAESRFTSALSGQSHEIKQVAFEHILALSN